MTEFLIEVGFTGALDMALMSLLVYAVLRLFRRGRSGPALKGLLLVGALYLAAQELNLQLTTLVLQTFFAVLLVALVVIFREELRRFFEQVARWGSAHRWTGTTKASAARARTELLVRVLFDMARERIGALVVVAGKEPLDAHLEGGVTLDGQLSEELLRSLFDPHSIGHDGGVIVDKDIVTRFACHLPLSTNFEGIGHAGTRHAAALGLSERVDALCLVVSEERGVVSVAHHGVMHPVRDAADLANIIAAFFGDGTARPAGWRQWMGRDVGLKVTAVAVSVALWMVLVHGAQPTTKTYTAPVRVSGLAVGQTARVTPPDVVITLSGPRRGFYFVGEDRFAAVLPVSATGSRTTSRAVRARNLNLPRHLALKAVHPERVRIEVFVRQPTTQPALSP